MNRREETSKTSSARNFFRTRAEYELRNDARIGHYERARQPRADEVQNAYTEHAQYPRADDDLPRPEAFDERVVVKDCFVDRDRPPTLGSRAIADWMSGTAEVLKRLRASGASIVGYANLHEWMVGTTSLASAFGPVANPRYPTLIAGGSSGGSAALVAAGSTPLAIGSDAGGSIRIPAACCGVVGLKPTWGAVPTDGFVDDGSPIDHVGPIGRDVATVLTAFETLLGARCDLDDPDRLRVGIARPFFADVDDEVRARLSQVIAALRPHVASVEEVDVDATDEARRAIAAFILRDVAHLIARRYRQWRDLLQDATTSVVALGLSIDADERAAAEAVRRRSIDAWEEIFERVDVIVTPTLPTKVVARNERRVQRPSGRVAAEVAYVQWNAPMNLAGVPCISIPCGDLPSGGPVALSLSARRGRDDVVLALAQRLERILRES